MRPPSVAYRYPLTADSCGFSLLSLLPVGCQQSESIIDTVKIIFPGMTSNDESLSLEGDHRVEGVFPYTLDYVPSPSICLGLVECEMMCLCGAFSPRFCRRLGGFRRVMGRYGAYQAHGVSEGGDGIRRELKKDRQGIWFIAPKLKFK